MNSESCFKVSHVLGGLAISASELGYRAQALFAETLARLGAIVDDVARTGHPDVTARLLDATLRIQVKATSQSTFAIAAADLEGIRPRSTGEQGYLAILDLGAPVRWSLIEYARARVLLDQVVPLAMIKVMSNRSFSQECTRAFVDMVLENEASIAAFTFALVRKRTLDDSRERNNN